MEFRKWIQMALYIVDFVQKYILSNLWMEYYNITFVWCSFIIRQMVEWIHPKQNEAKKWMKIHTQMKLLEIWNLKAAGEKVLRYYYGRCWCLERKETEFFISLQSIFPFSFTHAHEHSTHTVISGTTSKKWKNRIKSEKDLWKLYFRCIIRLWYHRQFQ